jgi:hypothetical protein
MIWVIHNEKRGMDYRTGDYRRKKDFTILSFPFVLVFHYCDKILKKNNLKRKDLFLLMVSVHHGEKDMTKQNS